MVKEIKELKKNRGVVLLDFVFKDFSSLLFKFSSLFWRVSSLFWKITKIKVKKGFVAGEFLTNVY